MLLSPQAQLKDCPREQGGRVMLRCLRCFRSIGSLPEEDNTALTCPTCGSALTCEQGIWKALLPERVAHYARFVKDYEFIRASEGRGSTNGDYYLALPYRDLTGRLSSQWAIRARTFRYIERKILPQIRDSGRGRLRILDLGAGNGWMSYRLALRGHAPVAVDLLTNDRDGLGAAKHYQQKLGSVFPRVQAEVNNLPFASSQFDLVIFNASFHYSESCEKTFAEALRCVCDGGTVLIADTPWYKNERTGLQMLQERRALFIERFGFPSDQLKSLEYLTDHTLAAMERRFHIQWHTYRPYYGMRWHMRPLLAWLRRARKPSRFKIYTAKAAK